ncbi:ABC transporter substrate-binding protein [Paraburkholderia sp.]|uniref:ABC transporter substrate-binding protein n=1 Tax=Paraburkholderia sp. TaxID=1926495 RepID=UPI00238F333A|nr:ABC transporter substrate-binding protein [Paraburkholderia sp.]MDE1180862.1 ABC transporter substrate-binding protein [Paraburkholderia sp.]
MIALHSSTPRRGRSLTRHAAAFASMLALACSAPVATAQARGGTLNFVVTPEPTALVDLATTATNVLKVSPKVVEGLLEYDFAFRPKPSLATSWDIGDQGRKYVFHLRHGVRWHDGQPFTSADVAFSIQMLRQVHPRAKTTFANVTGIATPDPYTVVITLSSPAPYLIKAFSSSETPILPKHLYDGTDVLGNPANNAPVGTGPFRFVKWVRGSYIEYTRNNDYWDTGKPYLDGIVVKVIADAAARTVAFENGSVDLSGDTPVPLSDVARLKANPALGFETRGYEFQAGVARIEFNLDNPVLGNLKVRQAIASALDRDVIRKVVYYGYATPLASPIIPTNPYYDAAPTPYPFDIARANALLDQAGYPRKADGTRFALTVDRRSADTYRRLCEICAGESRDCRHRAQPGPARISQTHLHRPRLRLQHQRHEQPVRSGRGRGPALYQCEFPARRAVHQWLALQQPGNRHAVRTSRAADR